MPLKLGPFFLGRPTAVDELTAESESYSRDLNFRPPGVTREAPPLPDFIQQRLRSFWWSVDDHRVKVGKGRGAYTKAQNLLKGWRHFDLPWASVNAPPVQAGKGVVVTARTLGCWTLNPLRITYVEAGRSRVPGRPGERFQFAHATLEGHQLAGEERFAVSWDRRDDSVWYEIYTVSKPATPVAMLALPLLRHYQKRFAAESMAAMQREMDGSGK